jgi:DNA-binding response OmpR family regulator
MARIIVIDDDAEMRTMMEQLLLAAGYDVFTADEGSIGLALSHIAPVDLVITDLVMPGMEGLETIRKFRREFPEVPIIAMTGNPNLGNMLLTAIRMGARSLAKPFQPDELLALVKTVLRVPPDPSND